MSWDESWRTLAFSEANDLCNGFIIAALFSGGTGEPIHPVTKFTSHVDEAPFQPFIDYNTGKRYLGGNQLYWKTLPEIIREYVNHPENKFINGDKVGRMKRRHLFITEQNVKYLGKEANEIEETEIFGTSEKSYVEYGT